MTLELETFLPYRLDRLSDAISAKFQRIYRDQYAMTRPEWKVLAHLGQHETLTAREICRLTGLHKTKVSRAVSTLQKRRWLSRDRDETDRRIEHLTLTKLGRENYAALAALLAKREAEMLAVLGEEERQVLSSALASLENAVDGAK